VPGSVPTFWAIVVPLVSSLSALPRAPVLRL
jgi:hypothetical protein